MHFHDFWKHAHPNPYDKGTQMRLSNRKTHIGIMFISVSEGWSSIGGIGVGAKSRNALSHDWARVL